MIWSDLFAGLALMFVLEGLLPVISPGFFRQRMLEVTQLPDASVRLLGLFSLIGGAVLLYWVRHG